MGEQFREEERPAALVNWVNGNQPSLNAYSISRVTRTHQCFLFQQAETKNKRRDYLRKTNTANERVG